MRRYLSALRTFWSMDGAKGTIFLLAFVLTLAVFYKRRDHERMVILVRASQTDVPIVREFRKLSPKSIHYVSYYTGDYGTPTWNSFGPLYGRYMLKMQMEISISRDGKRLVSHKEPHFYLAEFHSVKEWWDRDHPKNVDATNIIDFGLEEWETLMRNNTDWKSIGIDLKRDSPVEGFDRYWKTEQRKGRNTTISLE